MKKYSFVFTFLILLGMQAEAQHIQNFKTTYDSVHVNLIATYDLVGKEPHYKVVAYSSVDGFKDPVLFATGDIGNEVKPGTNKKFTWDLKLALPDNFEDSISLQVVAMRTGKPHFYPPLNKEYARGKLMHLAWRGGEGDSIQLELLSNHQPTGIHKKVHNSGECDWLLPKSLKKAKELTIKITSVKTQEATTSTLFHVKKSKTLLWVLVPVAVAGGVAIITSLGGKNGDNTEADLPGAPTK